MVQAARNSAPTLHGHCSLCRCLCPPQSTRGSAPRGAQHSPSLVPMPLRLYRLQTSHVCATGLRAGEERNGRVVQMVEPMGSFQHGRFYLPLSRRFESCPYRRSSGGFGNRPRMSADVTNNNLTKAAQKGGASGEIPAFSMFCAIRKYRDLLRGCVFKFLHTATGEGRLPPPCPPRWVGWPPKSNKNRSKPRQHERILRQREVRHRA